MSMYVEFVGIGVYTIIILSLIGISLKKLSTFVDKSVDHKLKGLNVKIMENPNCDWCYESREMLLDFEKSFSIINNPYIFLSISGSIATLLFILDKVGLIF